MRTEPATEPMRTELSPFKSAIGTFFAEKNVTPIDVALLQPADPFLDSAGEDFRRLIFMTSDETGQPMCLRPEFTIPVCRQHIEKGAIPVRYGYCGTVFRQRRKADDEFVQAGIEDLGNENRVAADIAAVTDCSQAIIANAITRFDIVLGDQAVFSALMLALGLPKVWREKIIRDFGDPQRLNRTLDHLAEETKSPYEGIPDAIREHLSEDERDAIVDWIAAAMADAGLPLSSGRTPAAIAARLMRKVELASVYLRDDKRAILEEFLELEVPIEEASAALSAFQQKYAVDFGPSLKNLTSRLQSLTALRSDTVDLKYKAGFGRNLDYYTGMVFEIFSNSDQTSKPLAGGGRYDRLMALLGARGTIPAVGFSIWEDRVLEVQRSQTGSTR